MKNSKEYTKKVAAFYKAQKKNIDPAKTQTQAQTPLDTFVYGILLEFYTYPEAEKVIEKISEHFVDFNDLRVSRAEEIVDVLGDKDKKEVAIALTTALQGLFDKYDAISVDGLIELGKRGAKQEIEESGMLRTFALNYFSLMVMNAHALPMTAKMIEYVKDNDLVHPNSSDKEINGFLERQFGSSEILNFYKLLRQLSDDYDANSAKKAKNKATKKTVTKKTAKKKTTTKKATAKKKTATKKKTTTKTVTKKKTTAKKKAVAKKKTTTKKVTKKKTTTKKKATKKATRKK